MGKIKAHMGLGDRSGETESTSAWNAKGKVRSVNKAADIMGGHEPNWKKKCSSCEMFGGCFPRVDFGI